jgi:hypothetical protein
MEKLENFVLIKKSPILTYSNVLFRSKLNQYLLTHWARFSFLRKFFQDVIFMGSSLLVIALNDLFVISYRLVIVLFFVSSHNESSFASNWDCLSQFFVLFHVIYNMCEKKEENSKFFSVILILLSFSI